MPSGYETEYPYDESGKMMGGAEEVEIADPLTWLAFAAAVIRDIKLGTSVLVLPQRNSVVLAKLAATLEVLSDGRLLLDVGVGWLAEGFEDVGVPFADRGRRHDDYVQAMRALWRDTNASVRNTDTNFGTAISLPQPAGRAAPIVIGGRSSRSARRAAEIGKGYFPSITEPHQLCPLLDVMNAEAARLQRDPVGIEVTVPYIAALDRVVALPQQFADPGVARTLLAGLGEDTLRPLLKQLADRIDLN